MSHVTCVWVVSQESWRYKWVMSRKFQRLLRNVEEREHNVISALRWGVPRIWMSHLYISAEFRYVSRCMNQSCHVQRSHVSYKMVMSRAKEPRHRETYLISARTWGMSHVWMSHDIGWCDTRDDKYMIYEYEHGCMNHSCHVQRSHVTYKGVTSRKNWSRRTWVVVYKWVTIYKLH